MQLGGCTARNPLEGRAANGVLREPVTWLFVAVGSGLPFRMWGSGSSGGTLSRSGGLHNI